jgi:transposase
MTINEDLKGAPFGMRHGKATAEFAEVELARTLHEQGLGPKEIAYKLGRSIHTVTDWVHYRTRCYG